MTIDSNIEAIAKASFLAVMDADTDITGITSNTRAFGDKSTPRAVPGYTVDATARKALDGSAFEYFLTVNILCETKMAVDTEGSIVDNMVGAVRGMLNKTDGGPTFLANLNTAALSRGMQFQWANEANEEEDDDEDQKINRRRLFVDCEGYPGS